MPPRIQVPGVPDSVIKFVEEFLGDIGVTYLGDVAGCWGNAVSEKLGGGLWVQKGEIF
jgi:hypothetical protein